MRPPTEKRSSGTCVAVGSGPKPSGQCICAGNVDCPLPPGGARQSCINSLCTCSGNDAQCGTSSSASCVQYSPAGVSNDYCQYK
ncbi:MAG: hypothetical protein ACYC8T_23935 [Myxococcaceae bacterium]